jgi:hypothetical protein
MTMHCIERHCSNYTLVLLLPGVSYILGSSKDESDSPYAIIAPAEANEIAAQQIQSGPLITAAGQCVAAGTGCPDA